MSYLIDGYNLLHAMGAIPGRTGPHGLEKARLRLLGLLHGVFGEKMPKIVVVFDAAGAPPGSKGEADYEGIHVLYAIRHQQADDLIEELIRRDSTPQKVSVVSDDHRIQQAARRRECVVLGCLDFLEELAQRRRQQNRPASKPKPEKKEKVSPAEMQHWLDEFADLENDPRFKEVFEPFDFGEEDASGDG